MDYLDVLATIAVVQLLGAASPGPNFLIVTSYSVGGTRKLAIASVIGVLTASFAWALMAAVGLGALVANFPAIYAALQYLGAAYMLWIGAKMLIKALRAGDSRLTLEAEGSVSAWQAARAGFLTNLGNPKSIAYYSSIFALAFPIDPPVWLFGAAVGTAMAVSAIWWFSVALFFGAGPIRRAYERARRVIDAMMGGLLIALGLRMAMTR